MKKLLIDAGIIILMCVVFFVFKVTGIIPILVALLFGIAAHVLLGWLLDKKAEEKIIRELDSEAEERICLKDLCLELVNKYSEIFLEEVEKFKTLVSKFDDIKVAILKITKLTGENSEYVIQASNETEEVMCNIANLLRIKLITLEALDENSEQYKDTQSEVNALLKTAEDTCKEYSNLLTEASKAADNKIDSAHLKEYSDRLRDLRKRNEKAYNISLSDGSDDLFGTTSSGGFDDLFGTTLPGESDYDI